MERKPDNVVSRCPCAALVALASEPRNSKSAETLSTSAIIWATKRESASFSSRLNSSSMRSRLAGDAIMACQFREFTDAPILPVIVSRVQGRSSQTIKIRSQEVSSPDTVTELPKRRGVGNSPAARLQQAGLPNLACPARTRASWWSAQRILGVNRERATSITPQQSVHYDGSIRRMRRRQDSASVR